MWNERKNDPVTCGLLGITMQVLNRIYPKVEVRKSHWVWLGAESRNSKHRTPMIKFGVNPMSVRRVIAMALCRHDGCTSTKRECSIACKVPGCVSPHCVVVTTRGYTISKGYKRMPEDQKAAWVERKRNSLRKSSHTVLTPAKVAMIRAQPPSVTSASIAARLGVHPSTVAKARSGDNWADVPATVVSPETGARAADPFAVIAAALAC